MGFKFILSLVFALIIAVFAIQNSASVSINFIFWNAYISQALVILISAIFGAVIVLIFSVFKSFRLNGIISSNKKALAELENENKFYKSKLEEARLKLKENNKENHVE